MGERVASGRLAAVAGDVPRRERDRSVVAMLIHPDGTLLDAAVNTNAENRCLHAEVNLLARWLPGFGADEDEADGDRDEPPRRLFPRGSRMLVTLQCCRMCAALACAASDAVGGEGLAEVGTTRRTERVRPPQSCKPGECDVSVVGGERRDRDHHLKSESRRPEPRLIIARARACVGSYSSRVD